MSDPSTVALSIALCVVLTLSAFAASGLIKRMYGGAPFEVKFMANWYREHIKAMEAELDTHKSGETYKAGFREGYMNGIALIDQMIEEKTDSLIRAGYPEATS